MEGRQKGCPGDFSHLAELAAESIRQGGLIVEREKGRGFVNVLDEAQEVHAAFSAVAALAENALGKDVEHLRGGDLAALLRVINGRLGRAIDVACASAAGESGAVMFIRK